jgi:hypothetical protein
MNKKIRFLTLTGFDSETQSFCVQYAATELKHIVTYWRLFILLKLDVKNA